MIVASIIVKCIPSMVDNVVEKISKFPNVTTHGVHKEDNLIVLVEAETELEIENFSKTLLSEVDGILGTYPSFIASEDELENIEPEQIN